MNYKSDVVNLDVHLIMETPNAILVNLDETNEDGKCWLPKSQLEINRRQKTTINITLPEWLALNCKLI